MDKESLRKLLIKHYVKNYASRGDQYYRELIVHPVNNFSGAYFLTISGSGPKGYASYFYCEGKYVLTLYDCLGERFKDYHLRHNIDFDSE